MKTLIESYENRPGEHCGSTAMRNLIHHYCGLDLPEAVVFGLGSGIEFLLLESERFEPPILAFGRSASMEIDLATALGIDYREQTEKDDDEAWERVREQVAAGRPTMLSGDAYHLEYRDFRVHFPAHRFVLVGFDDAARVALVADRLDPQPQRCSLDALKLSRNPPDFVSTHNLWGRFHDTRVRHSLGAAYATAIERTARRMLGKTTGEPRPLDLSASRPPVRISQGLAALTRFANQLPGWLQRDDPGLLATYTSQCIEKFGTGGGNFRAMYAAFLRSARAVIPERVDRAAPDLAAQSSVQWTRLSRQLGEFGKTRSEALIPRCRQTLQEILGLETRLFELLGAGTATSRATSRLTRGRGRASAGPGQGGDPGDPVRGSASPPRASRDGESSD